jgi:hypothetical protein
LHAIRRTEYSTKWKRESRSGHHSPLESAASNPSNVSLFSDGRF